MDEGQTHPAGPAPALTPAAAAAPAPVLTYATARRQMVEAEWSSGPERVELRVPPPAVVWQLVPPSLALAVAFPLFCLGLLVTVGAALGSRVGGAVVFGTLTALSLRCGLRASRRLVRAARHGAKPTAIAVTPERLTLVSPWLPEDRPYQLPRFSITGLRLDEVQTLPGFVRYVRLRVILREEDFFDLRFPWRANFPLAHAEWRLHDALGLGPRNFGPPVAAALRTTDRCANSS